jgi:hypothetical protein
VIATLQPLETNLEEIFTKKVPTLPVSGRRATVQYLPWIALVLSILSAYTAWVLWHWAHYSNALLNYANSISVAYGGPPIAYHRMGLGIWLGIAVLLVEAYLYLAAFPAVRDRQKTGWDYLFYTALLNVAYGVVTLFSDYGSLGNLFGTVIGSAIGLYLLFQIRPNYLQPVVLPAKKNVSHKDATK